jgi:hypothetical protein
MISVPNTYKVDFSSDRQDLQYRAFTRMLNEFHSSPVLLQILQALVSEVQALSNAIIDVIEYRTLYEAQGVTLDTLGQIVGQNGAGYTAVVSGSIIEEDGTTPIYDEDGTDVITALFQQYARLGDLDHATLILLKIMCNFTQHGSVPEIADAIYQTTGYKLQIIRSGPAQIDLIVPPNMDPTLVAMLGQRISTPQADNVYLFPFPATCMVSAGFNEGIIAEDGVTPLIDQGQLNVFYSEFIPED